MKEVWLPSSSLLSLQTTTKEVLSKLCLKQFECEGFVFDAKSEQGQIIEQSVEQNMLKRGTQFQTLYLFTGQSSEVDETRFQAERNTLLSDVCTHRSRTNRILVTLTAGLVHHSNVANLIRT